MTATEPTYHHGDLPAALLDAAVDVIIERGGPANFSMREVARRAGVSHAAPAHHFGDSQGLLSALAAEGYRQLTAALQEARSSETNAADKLTACGLAYLRTAAQFPAHYSLMIDCDQVSHSDHPELQQASLAAYEQLASMMEDLRNEYNPDLDLDATATLIWAGVHGLVALSGDMKNVADSTQTQLSSMQDLVEKFTAMVIDGIRPR